MAALHDTDALYFSGAEIFMPARCKAPCPFQHSGGAGEATWMYVSHTSSWSTHSPSPLPR